MERKLTPLASPSARAAFQSDIIGAFPAMMTVGVGEAGHQRPDRRFGQPIRESPAQHAVALSALAGDHQHRAHPICCGVLKEIGQGAPGAILVEPMQIEPAANRITLPTDPPTTPRLDGMRRCRLAAQR